MSTRRKFIIAIVASTLFMQNLDTTILSTAIPEMARSLRTEPVRLHWAITGYLGSLAVFMPVSGWLADRFGTRKIFQLSVAIFTIASLASAFAPTLGWLVLARIAQGVGGAMMVPVARLALLREVPKTELISAMSWVSIPALLGPVLGPPVGGFIVTYWSWHWIFGLNLPVGAVGLVLGAMFLDDVKGGEVAPFDITGFVLLSTGLVVLIVALDTFGMDVLPLWANWLAVVFGLVVVTAYAFHSRRTPSPILSLSLLRVPTFSASVLGGGLFRSGLGAVPFLIPLLLQTSLGYSPLEAGSTTLAMSVGALTMKFAAERLIKRLGFRHTLTWSALLSAVFVAACMCFTPSTYAVVIFVVLMVGGFFRSLTLTALNSIAYADLNPKQISQSTGFVAVVQQLSVAAGVAISAALLDYVGDSDGVLRYQDFAIPFGVVAILMATPLIQFLMLPPDAGSEVSGKGKNSKEP